MLRHQSWPCRVLGARTSTLTLVSAARATAVSGVVVVSHLASGRQRAVESIRAVNDLGVAVFYAGNAFATPRARRGVPGRYLGVHRSRLHAAHSHPGKAQSRPHHAPFHLSGNWFRRARHTRRPDKVNLRGGNRNRPTGHSTADDPNEIRVSHRTGKMPAPLRCRHRHRQSARHPNVTSYYDRRGAAAPLWRREQPKPCALPGIGDLPLPASDAFPCQAEQGRTTWEDNTMNTAAIRVTGPPKCSAPSSSSSAFTRGLPGTGRLSRPQRRLRSVARVPSGPSTSA